MSSLRAPILGPIVGHTTSTTCRLWIKGSDPGDQGSDLAQERRTVGVITVLTSGGKADPGDPSRTQYFRLHREFDRSGTFTLGGQPGLDGSGPVFTLEPDRSYRVRMGTLALDDSFDNAKSVPDSVIAQRLPPASIWANELTALPAAQSEAVFRTFPESPASRLSFILGSCRYPGLLWKAKKSDRIFEPILKRTQARSVNRPRFLMMMGDQIYADMFSRYVPIGLADTYEEFQDRYNKAFGSPNMRDLLRQTPTYMILDDHEIEDNWTQDRILESGKRRLFHLAIGAYMSHQWVHGPRNFGKRLYYHFECSGYPFFVLDTRTQRYKESEESISDNHLLGCPSLDPENEPSQLDQLCRWLSRQQKEKGDRPKFIVTSNVFVPNSMRTIGSEKRKNESDSWPAFPNTRRTILRRIVSEGIQNVIFLSGDIHVSNVAQISFSGSRKASRVRAFAVTSSAFYWPFPFADGDPSGYVHDSTQAGQLDSFRLDRDDGQPADPSDEEVSRFVGVKMDYRASHFTQDDNFGQIDLDWPNKRLRIRFFSKEGEELARKELDLA